MNIYHHQQLILSFHIKASPLTRNQLLRVVDLAASALKKSFAAAVTATSERHATASEAYRSINSCDRDGRLRESYISFISFIFK